MLKHYSRYARYFLTTLAHIGFGGRLGGFFN
jgi:hypothetical protein